VIVDPPRKGLDGPLLEALVDAPPPRLVYLACDRTSLARDLARLRESGRLVLRGIEAFDFFPFTEHVETLVWLDRAGEHFDDVPDPSFPPAAGTER
jgi:23S rRNA (uracil1939-C5)-methyltransferase